MANPEKGEVDLVVGDKTYVLRIRTNTVCEIEAKSGKAWGDLWQDVKQTNIQSMRTLLFALLQPYHKKEFPTMDAVGDLIDQMHGTVDVFDVLLRILTVNKPPAKDAKEGDANPPVAQPGTGTSSISTDAGSV